MNKYNNVQMWVALDDEEQQVFIDNAKLGQDYFCPSCGGIVRARAKDSECVTEHFYHLNKSNCSGESLLHIYWKNNLIKIGETIILPTVGEVTCIDKRVEFAFNTSEGKYQPDLIIKTNNPKYKFIIFEIHNTNPKIIEDYYNKWNELKYTVFEVDVKGLDKDKSNLDEQLTLLYSFQKEIFIKNSKNAISTLYNLLKNNPIIKETREKYIPPDLLELIDLGVIDEEYVNQYSCQKIRKYDLDIRPILSQFYKIFKNNLENYTSNTIKSLNEDINSNNWNEDTYKYFVQPLMQILAQLKLYCR